MRYIQLLLLALLIGNFACSKNEPVDPTTTWQGGCSSFYTFEGQYRYSNCCNLLIFQNLELKKGKTVSGEAALENFSFSNGTTKSTTIAKISLSKDGKSLKITYTNLSGDTSSDELTNGFNGPVCDCACP